MRPILFIALLALVSCATAADKKSFTLTATRNAQDISRTVIVPGDVPGHELAQRVYVYSVKADDPDFAESTMLHYGYSDSVYGTGTHGGYATWMLKGGDSVFIKFSGTQEVRGEGEAKETKFQGHFEIQRGTGKFKNAKGSSAYAGGQSGANDAHWEAKVELTY